jgi:hypothetical protein
MDASTSAFGHGSVAKNCQVNLQGAGHPDGFRSSNCSFRQQRGGRKQMLAEKRRRVMDFCDMPTMATVLNAFSGNCSAELAGNTAVPSVVVSCRYEKERVRAHSWALGVSSQSVYDAIYLVKPLKNAMCTTNPSTGNACMLEIAGTTTSASGNATVSQPAKAVSDIAPVNATVRNYAMLSSTFDVAKYAGDAFVPANL